MNPEAELLKRLLRPLFYDLMAEYEELKMAERPPEPARSKLLRAREVSEILDVHVKQVYRLASQGKLTPVPNLGRRVRFNPDEVERVRREGFANQSERSKSNVHQETRQEPIPGARRRRAHRGPAEVSQQDDSRRTL